MDDETKKPEEMSAREYLDSIRTDEQRAELEKAREELKRAEKQLSELEEQKNQIRIFAAGLTGAIYYIRKHNLDGTEVREEEFVKTEEWQTLSALIKSLHQKSIPAETVGTETAPILKEMLSITPFLIEELEKLQESNGGEIIKLYQLLALGFSEDKDNPVCKPYIEAVERARRRRYKDKDGVTSVRYSPVEDIIFPIDKPNSLIWNQLEKANADGQFRLDIDTTPKQQETRGRGRRKTAAAQKHEQGNEQQAVSLVYYSINFSALKDNVRITKQLTPFDKRVYIAAGAAWNAGNQVVSLTQIYRLMGNSGKPSNRQLKDINDSLTKMRAAVIYVDNGPEIEADANTKYKKFVYDGALLPFERESAIINDHFTDAAIHLFREPPFIEFARGRGQITTLSLNLLDSPIKKTAANLRLEDYLLERISQIRTPRFNTSNRMLYSTIFTECGIETIKQQQRAPKKIKRYLDHYKSTGWIDDYKMDERGITIIYRKKSYSTN